MGEIDESKADTVKVNGKVVGYKADNVFEPLPNIKGDIARIFLYVYTCWQQPNLFFDVAADRLPALEKTNSANKNDGLRVIESLETLLQWNYIDPVDTWEMSQNDIGEIIQGNRNVFIDYPEYAWLIFDLDVPEGIVSPVSENRALGTYVPGDLSDKYTEAESQIDESELISIAEANNEAAGKLVTVKGEVIYRFGAGDSLDSAIIRDENGDSIQLYFGGGMFRYHAGDTVMVKGTIAEYHGVKQISGFVSKSVATGNGTASVAPIEVTFEELNANIDNYVSKLVSVKDVVLGSKSDGSITVTQTVDGKESELVLYKAPSYPEGIARTDKVDIIGIATKRDTQAQIRVGSSSDYTLVEKGPGYVADLTTVEGILDAAFSLEDKETLGQAVTLTGKITSIQTAYSSEYNNISVNIEVSGKTILCYRLKGGRTLKVGEVITVTGDIQNYGGTIEFVKDSTYVGENSSSGDATPTPTATTTPTPTGTTTPAPTGTSAPDPTAIPGDVKVLVTEEEEQILEKAFALETGKSLEEECSLRGIVIEITPVQTSSSVSNTKVFAAVKPTYNVKIKTGDKEILCYKLANAEKLKVGDAIKVTGKIQNYQGTVEFKANSTYVKCTTSGVLEKINSVDVLVSGKYVIYATKGDYAGALGNTVKSGKVDPVAVAPENGVFTDPDSNIVWVVEKDAETGVITLYNEAVQKYLVISSNAVAGFELADTAKYGYTVSALQESDPSNIFLKTTLNGSKRGISLFGVDFRAYDANTAINNKAVLNLYRLAAVNLTPVAEPTGTPTPTPTEPTGTPVSAEFEQITSFEDIEDGKYIFVTNLNDVLYALDKAPGEGRGANTRGGVVVTAADGKVYSESTSIVWTVTKVTNDDGSVHYTIQDEDGKYLSMSNTGYNYPFSATTNDDAVSEFTAFVFSAGTNENAVLVQNPANGRYISALINNDAFQDYRGYDAEKKCKPLYLYKLVEKV